MPFIAEGLLDRRGGSQHCLSLALGGNLRCMHAEEAEHRGTDGISAEDTRCQ